MPPPTLTAVRWKHPCLSGCWVHKNSVWRQRDSCQLPRTGRLPWHWWLSGRWSFPEAWICSDHQCYPVNFTRFTSSRDLHQLCKVCLNWTRNVAWNTSLRGFHHAYFSCLNWPSFRCLIRFTKRCVQAQKTVTTKDNILRLNFKFKICIFNSKYFITNIAK